MSNEVKVLRSGERLAVQVLVETSVRGDAKLDELMRQTLKSAKMAVVDFERGYPPGISSSGSLSSETRRSWIKRLFATVSACILAGIWVPPLLKRTTLLVFGSKKLCTWITTTARAPLNWYKRHPDKLRYVQGSRNGMMVFDFFVRGSEHKKLKALGSNHLDFEQGSAFKRYVFRGAKVAFSSQMGGESGWQEYVADVAERNPELAKEAAQYRASLKGPATGELI